MALSITDPTYTRPSSYPFYDRWALKLLNDPRDLPFVHLAVMQSVLVIPFAVFLFLPGHFSWWMALLYEGLVIGFYAPPFILMLHNTSHRKLFKRPYEWLNLYIPWVLGPFFGESPETYFAHHIGMHHPENNLEADLSSTMPYQRDSMIDFGRYFLRFLFRGLVELNLYFSRKHRFNLMRRCIGGELSMYLLIAGTMLLNWRAGMVVFLIPLLVTRFAMMAGNWGQHAFIDASAPGNCYRNSITCINATYNRRCFNDGYHIGHHLKATRHWTEMPVEFSAELERYAAEDAIVFQGIDFFMVWLFLMFKRYDWLAKRYVSLADTRPDPLEIEALLRQRAGRIPARAAFRPGSAA